VNVPRHPKTSTKKNSRAVCCVVQFFININNETLVWSEKDGGSAFAGGNDGQGDKLLTRFFLSFLSFLSLFAAAFLAFQFSLLESQSLF
jgi:hypothetical protein